MISAPHLQNGPIPEKPFFGVLSFPELYVSVKPYNEISTKRLLFVWPLIPVKLSPEELAEHIGKTFYVELCFYPHEAEPETPVPPFSFDPFSVTLLLKDKTTHKPIGFYGPDYINRFEVWTRSYRPYYSSGLRFSVLYDDERYGKPSYIEGSIEKPIRLLSQEWTCVLLKFDIPTLHPQESFKLIILGLSKNGSSVDLPEIHFNIETISIAESAFP